MNTTTGAAPTNSRRVWATHRNNGGCWLLAIVLALLPGVSLAAGSASISSPQTISGTVGGPFTPASQQLTLTTSGFTQPSNCYYGSVGTNGTWLTATVPGSEGVPCSQPITVQVASSAASLSPGEYTARIEVTLYDTGCTQALLATVTTSACSQTVSASTTVKLEVLPKVTITSPGGPRTLFVGQSLNFTASATGNNLLFHWTFGFGTTPSSSSAQNPGTVTFNRAGRFQVTVKATVPGTNLTASDSVAVTVAGLSVAITSPANGSTVQLGQPVNFTASVNPPTTGLIFSWHFGSGANPATSNAQNPTNIVFNTAGARTIGLTVSDPVSGQQSNTQITVNVEGSSPPPPTTKPPDVTVNGPVDGTSVVVGGSLVFSATASGSQGSQFNYLWQFGPGSDPATSTSAGPTTVRFTQIGTNVVQLTVTDTSSGLTTVKSVTVVVQQPTSDQAQNQLELFATTPGQRSVASVLGQLCTQTGLMANLQQDCTNLLNSAFNNDPLVSQALASLTPDIVQTPGSSVFNASLMTSNIIQARLQALLSGSNPAFSVNGMNLDIAGNTINGSQLAGLLRGMTGGSAGDSQGDSGFSRFSGFISGRYGKGRHDTTDQLTGYDSHNTAVTLGADYRLTDKLIMGAAISYNDTSTAFQNSRGHLDSKDYAATLYGTFYQNQNLFIDGSVTYGRSSFDQRRHVSYALANAPAVDQTFAASFNGNHLGLDLDAGYQIQRGGFTITPSARLQYLKINVDGYQESGVSNPGAPGSGWGVAIDPQSYKSLTVNLGGQVSYAWSQSWGVLLPYVGLEWVHDFEGGNNGTVDGRFLGDPTGTGFALPLDGRDSNYFNLEVGASAQFTHGTSGFISYRRTLGYRNANYYSINAGLRLEF